MGGCVGECMYIEPGYIHVNFDEVTKTKPMNEKIQRKRATTVIKTEKYRIATRGIESKQASKQASKQEGPSPPKANTPDVLEGKLSHARFESPNAPTAQWWLPNASISGSPAGEARATRAQTPFLVEDYF